MKCLKLYLMGIVTYNMLKWDMVNGPCNYSVTWLADNLVV
jgi:hypothetical protein